MKRTLGKKLTLNRETLRHLDQRELTWVNGGLAYPTEAGCQTDSCQTCQATGCNPTIDTSSQETEQQIRG